MLPFSSERYEQLRDHSLLLRLLSLRDLGAYTCQAYNGLGRADSWTVEVYTQSDPGTISPEDEEFKQFVIRGADVVGEAVPSATTTTTTTTENTLDGTVGPELSYIGEGF
jgi:hypothetical protein